MASQLFCAACGLEVPLDVMGEPELVAYTACGNKVFVPARWIEWSAALSEKDKMLLKALRIAIT